MLKATGSGSITMVVAIVGLWLTTGTSASPAMDCSLTSTGNVPLSDLAGSYRGFPGGLYPGGASVRPQAHDATGIARAEQVQPLDAEGRSDPANGRIVLLSIGMSNTVTEFGRFVDLVRTDPAKNPHLTIVNGAMGGRTADQWADPSSSAWQSVFDQLARNNVTRQQVQVAWVKAARAGFGSNTSDPPANFPSFPQALQTDLENISRNLKTHFPNVRIAYFSSRIRAYTAPPALSPEPTAYETGFAVRWAVARQIEGASDLLPAVAPWMAWGPYLWADGLSPRSDGLTYACSDLAADFIHPAAGATQKVADQLRAFFSTDPTASPWFLKTATAPPVIDSVSASPPGGDPGVRVQFSAGASDANGIREYIWTFGDGTYAYGPNPQKTFNVAGRYPIRLAVVDQSGNASLLTITIDVGNPAGTAPGAPRNLRIVRLPALLEPIPH